MSFFRAGSTVLRQDHGLPMGSFLAPCLADIFCMYREHLNTRLWKHIPFRTRCLRFRDNVMLITGAHVTDDFPSRLVDTWNLMYGPALTVTLESFSRSVSTFLGMKVWCSNGTLYTMDHNKNAPSLRIIDLAWRPRRIRFLSTLADWNISMYKSTILGQLIAVNRRSNSPVTQFMATLLQCIEWMCMGYPLKWIRPNLYRARTSHTRLISLLLWYISNRRATSARQSKTLVGSTTLAHCNH
jgi:hypothetical protein